MNFMPHARTHHHDHQRPLHAIGVYLCLVGLLAIAFSITLRVIPNAIHVELLALLHTTPQVLNELNGVYQYSLIATLVLSGLFVDIIGPRTVLVVALMIAVVSNHFFATSDSVTALINSRVLIGYTHPFILTSVLTLGTHWLPRRHFSLFVGVLFGVLLMVPMADYAPLQSLNSLSTLRRAILAVNLIGIFIICSIVLTEQILDRTRHRHTLKALFKPLTYHKVWLICLVSMVGWIANTFLLHYGAFYLIWHFDFSMKHAIDIVHTSFIFFGIGVVFMGMLSDYLAKKRYLISLFYTLTALMICILVFVPGLPIRLVPILFFLTSFFASSTIICYTKANDYCTIGNSGITLGLVLSITTIGSSLFVRITGSVLQKYVNDSVQANPNNWEMLLAVLPVILFLLLGATIAMLLKPVHFKAHHHRDDLDPNNPHPLPATAALPEVSPELNSTASTIKPVNPKPKKKPKKKS